MMKDNNKRYIACNMPIVMMACVAIIFVVVSIIVVLQEKMNWSLIFVPLLIWISFVVFYIIIKPRIIFTKNHLQFISWENGTPYDFSLSFSNLLRLPKTKITAVRLNSIVIFGCFNYQDVLDYCNKHSGYFLEQLSDITSNFIEINTRSMWGKTKNAIIIIDDSGASMLIDVDSYDVLQIEDLLFNIEEQINKKSIGRISAISRNFSNMLCLVKSVFEFLLIFVFPILVIYFAYTIAPITFNENGLLNFLLFIAVFIANLLVIQYFSLKKSNYSSQNGWLNKKRLAGISALIAYILAGVLFYFICYGN